MSEIVITEVCIFPVKPTPKGLVGFASCTFNHQLALNSICIYTRPSGQGYRLVYPDKTLRNGKVINIFHPINKQAGELLHQAIIRKFEDLIDQVVVGES